MELCDLDSISPLERKILEEQYLISHILASQGKYQLAIFPKSTATSILVNEEDHLRIQAISPGFTVKDAWKNARTLENCLAEKLDFAYSEQYGYLTTCPSNAGLGLRVSAMMFVPGLIMLKRIAPLIRQYASTGYTFRGSYGEGSQSQGFLLQMSYQQPHEHNAESILRKLEAQCYRMIQQEKLARIHLLTSATKTLRQSIIHAQRELLTTQQMGVKTGGHLLAMYRLGISLGLLSLNAGTGTKIKQQRYRELQLIDTLFIRIQPAHIRKYGIRQYQLTSSKDDTLPHDDEDTFRAKLLRTALGN
jgi:protein arginine kinase